VGTRDQNSDGARQRPERTVTGHGQAVSELARELTWALAEQPRVLVCDLTAMPVSALDAAQLFAPVVRYLADWPGAGVVVVSTPDAQVWAGLVSHPMPQTLILSESREAGVAELQGLLPSLRRADTRLDARLTAPRTARLFTARSLLGWELMPLVSSACLVVSELVTNAVVHAASEVDLTLSRADGRVQMTVRDHGAGHPTPRLEEPDSDYLGGRGLLLVQHSTRGWGVFPAEAEGKTVWAIFDAP
jgi:Histidine kinase-like ATPase domain